MCINQYIIFWTNTGTSFRCLKNHIYAKTSVVHYWCFWISRMKLSKNEVKRGKLLAFPFPPFIPILTFLREISKIIYSLLSKKNNTLRCEKWYNVTCNPRILLSFSFTLCIIFWLKRIVCCKYFFLSFLISYGKIKYFPFLVAIEYFPFSNK